MALWSDGIAAWRDHPRWPPRRHRDRAGHRRCRGALEPHHQPAGGDRRRSGSRSMPPGRISPISSSASSTPRRWRCRARASTASCSPRRFGARARCFWTPPAGASPTSSPRATRSPPQSSTECERGPRRPMCCSTFARSPRRAFPTSSPPPRGRARSAREPVPVAPAAHYLMGGIVVRPPRAVHARGPLRGRRVLVHRAPRSQPPRLELAHRVLRVRRPRRAAAAEEPPPPTPPARPDWRSTRRPKRPGTRSGAWPGPAQPRRPGGAGLQPLPAGERDRDRRPESPRVPGGHLRTDSPQIDHGLDGVHFVLSPGGEVRREEWR